MFPSKKLMPRLIWGWLFVIILTSNLYSQSLELVVSYDSLQRSVGITLAGNYAYVTDAVRGLVILDITNPAIPEFRGSYNASMYEYDIAVSNGLAYIGAGISEPYMGGLNIVDITNPSSPALLGSMTSFPWEVTELEVVGNYAYLETFGGSYIIDVHDVAAPHIDTTFTPPGFVSDFDFDSLLYASCWTAGLAIFDINNPVDPQIVGICDTPGGASAVALNRAIPKYAFIADLDSGLQTIDISTLSNPVLTGNVVLPSRSRDVAVTRYYAFVATDSGLVVIDISDPAAPAVVVSSNLAQLAKGLAVNGEYVYVVCDTSLKVFRFSPPACNYIPGDVNGNNIANGVDVVFLLNYFKGGHIPIVQCDSCSQAVPFFAAADVNGSCTVNSVDITYFVGCIQNQRPLRYCADCPPESW